MNFLTFKSFRNEIKQTKFFILKLCKTTIMFFSAYMFNQIFHTTLDFNKKKTAKRFFTQIIFTQKTIPTTRFSDL